MSNIPRVTFTNPVAQYSKLTEHELANIPVEQIEAATEASKKYWSNEPRIAPSYLLPRLLDAYFSGKEAEAQLETFGLLEMANNMYESLCEKLSEGSLE